MKNLIAIILCLFLNYAQSSIISKKMQKIHFSFLDDDKTFDLNIKSFITSREGRYHGFAFGASNATTSLPFSGGLTLSHYNGLQYPTEDDASVLTSKAGFWITKQGNLVSEDGAINLPITTNSSSFDRIDLIVGTHEYVPLSGGSPAFYSVVTGTPSATPVAPSVPNPKIDVIIGTLFVPAGSGSTITNIDRANYTPARMPNFAADDSIPHVDWANVFTKFNIFRGWGGEIGNAKLIPTGVPNEYYIDLSNEGAEDGQANFYLLDTQTGVIAPDYYDVTIILPSNMSGARNVTFYATMNVRIKSSSNIQTSGGKDVYIDAHTPFTITRWGFAGLNLWQLIEGEQSSKVMPSKHRAVIMESAEPVTVTATGAIDRVGNGNTLRITSTLYDVRWIKSIDKTVNGTTYTSEVGTRLVLSNRTSNLIIIQTELHASAGLAPAPTGYKRILNPNGYDISIGANGSVTLVETEEYWEVTAIQGETPHWKPVVTSATNNLFVARVGSTIMLNGQIFLHESGNPAISADSNTTLWSFPMTRAKNGKYTYIPSTLDYKRLPIQHGATGVGTTEWCIFNMDISGNVKMFLHNAISSGDVMQLRASGLSFPTYW